MEELGSGFYLAMHDLEIRGAGEVLGENQSGNMLEVGFQLYNEMLAEAVRSLKAGKEPDLLAPLSVTTEINLHAPALLPDNYCGDVHLRLSFYKRLATAKTTDQIDALLEEIVDRFGKLPPQAQTLIDVHRLRVLARPYGVVKVDAAPGVIHITFKPNPPIDPMRIIELVQKNRHIKLAGNEKLRIERDAAGTEGPRADGARRAAVAGPAEGGRGGVNEALPAKVMAQAVLRPAGARHRAVAASPGGKKMHRAADAHARDRGDPSLVVGPAGLEGDAVAVAMVRRLPGPADARLAPCGAGAVHYRRHRGPDCRARLAAATGPA